MEAVVRPPITAPARAGRGTAVVLGLALFIGLGFVAGFALPYFAGGGQIALYSGKEVWLFMHIGGGMVALLAGPGQLWLGQKRRRLNVHRKLGLVYIGSIGRYR